jgi:hypothetical protein
MPHRTATMKINTEEVVLASCLAIGWALTTIARDLLAPMASAVLAALGYRPGPPLAYVESNGKIIPTWDKIKLDYYSVLANPSLGQPWPPISETLLDDLEVPNYRVCISIPKLHHNTTTYTHLPSPADLHNASLPQLRRMANLLGMNSNGLSKESLMEALLDEFFDRSNDYSSDVPTAEERSPSVKRRPMK